MIDRLVRPLLAAVAALGMASAAVAQETAPPPAADHTAADRAKLKSDLQKKDLDRKTGRESSRAADKVQLQHDRAALASDTGHVKGNRDRHVKRGPRGKPPTAAGV